MSEAKNLVDDIQKKSVEATFIEMENQPFTVVCAALEMTESELLLAGPERVTKVTQGDCETYFYDGIPVASFWPIEARTEHRDGRYYATASRKYVVHFDTLREVVKSDAP